MSGEAILVIDVQNCFLPGGSLATANVRDKDYPASTLGTSIAKYINAANPEHVFISKDWHNPGHSSFVSAEQKAQGLLNFPSAAAIGEYGRGIASGRYASRKFTGKRAWGKKEERMDQKLWPEHCVQDTSGAMVDAAFLAALSPANQQKAVTILKGDTPDIDSYSVVADALGSPTPHDESGRSFISILKESNITKISLTGIARDVCVFWSALDILNYWILPQYASGGSVVKLVFMYDLTRPVSPVPGAPYTDKTPEQITDEVKALIKNKGLKPEVINEVFEIKMGGYGTSASGGARRFKRTMRKKVRSTRRRY
jgi:nicotinamidase-related amidase